MPTPEIMYEFKVLRGRHVESKDETGKQIIYNPGDTIKTKSDLRRFNTDSGRKFELLSESEIKPRKSGKA